MAGRPDFLRGSGKGGLPSDVYRSLVAGGGCREPFRHVISLGPRCSNASSVYKAQRCYAGPFDWIFSSAQMSRDCLKDNFVSFLDPSNFFEVGKAFDAIGLPPGSAPRERALIGHRKYSEMTEGVGRGVIFNHHNPLTEEGHAYVERCVRRIVRALQIDERKLYTFINIDKKLWKPADIINLFQELAQRDQGCFIMLAVNCIKHCGEAAKQQDPKVLEVRQNGRGTLQILEVPCVGENSGSYFRDSFDAQRIQALMVEPFLFNPSEDPLKRAPASLLPGVTAMSSKSNVGGYTSWKHVAQAKELHDQPSQSWKHVAQAKELHDQPPQSYAEASQQPCPESSADVTMERRGRWNRARGTGKSSSEKADVQNTSSMPTDDISLRNGIKMPRLGLGTWQAASGGACRAAVELALSNGCRLVDTAAAYKNEEDVGKAIASAPHRSGIFLVTKLQTKEHGSREGVLRAFRTSLQRLAVDYVDLYLMHSPRGGTVLQTWDAMLEARDMGLTKAVGVSNFGIAQLQGLKDAGRELPAVNQIELHPWLQQRDCVAWCNAENVAVMAYSPLARGKCFEDDQLAAMATRLRTTAADLCIRWALAKGFIVIPKSVTAERIRRNISALSSPQLLPEDIALIDQLDCNYKVCAPASNAMDIPWERIAEQEYGDKGKGSKGKGKGKAENFDVLTLAGLRLA